MKTATRKKTISLLLTAVMIVTVLSAFTTVCASTVNVKPDGHITPFEKYGRLQIINAQLCDEGGNPVQLKGMSTHGLQWGTSTWLDDNTAAFDAFAYDWKIDIFRLAMYVGENGYGFNDDRTLNLNAPEILARLEQFLQMSTERGMYVMVDWHVHAPGNPIDPRYLESGLHSEVLPLMPAEFQAIYAANPAWTGPQVFFAYIAQKYGAQGNIFYEPANEPSTNNAGGGMPLANSQAAWTNTLKPYFDGVVNAIRVYDKTGIVICGSPNWTQQPNYAIAAPVADPENTIPQIMYSIHFYTGTHNFTSFSNTINNTRNAGHAIFANEWGVSQSSGDGGPYLNSADTWLSFFENNKISWTAWSVGRKDEISAAFPGVSANPTLREDGIYRWAEKAMSIAGLYYRAKIRGDGPLVVSVYTQATDLRGIFYALDPDSPNRSITLSREKLNGAIIAKATGVSAGGAADNIIVLKNVNTPYGSHINLEFDVYLPVSVLEGAGDGDAIILKPVIDGNAMTESAIPLSAFEAVEGADLATARASWPVASLVPAPAATARANDIQIMFALTAATAGADAYFGPVEFSLSYNGDVNSRPTGAADPPAGTAPSVLPYTFAGSRQGWARDGGSYLQNKDLRTAPVEGETNALIFPAYFAPGENEWGDGYRMTSANHLQNIGGANAAARQAWWGERRYFAMDVYLESGRATQGALTMNICPVPNGGSYWYQIQPSPTIDPVNGGTPVVGADGRELIKFKIFGPFNYAAAYNSATILPRNIVLALANDDSDYEGLVYYANIDFWTTDQYVAYHTKTVTFDPDGGDWDGEASAEVWMGDPVVRPADPVQPACNFAGWYTEDGELYDFDSPVYDDFRLVAKWSVDVTFEAGAGIDAIIQVIDKGSVPDFVIVDRFEYVLTAWYTDEWLETPYDFETPLYGHTTLYAGWEFKPSIIMTGATNGNKQSSVDFNIRSANGKGYILYLSETGVDGSFKVYGDVNYNAKGAHIKGLTNGKIYYVRIQYVNGGFVENSGVIMIAPDK